MTYQLVLQFRGDTLADYDAMVALENRLIEDLGHSAKVDGHDCGSDETNICIVACVERGLADNQVSVGEAELMRAICTVIECPLPP